jgi:hypothetical protein
MRSEQEVRQMIAELEQIDDFYGQVTARAVIAALRNVLDGPKEIEECGCVGPRGCCYCQVRSLAMRAGTTSQEPTP